MLKLTPKSRVRFTRSQLAAVSLLFGVFVLLFTSVFLYARTRTAYAAANNTINFQARLESSNGAIAPDGNYNVEFKLYDTSAPGSGHTEDQGACTYNGGTADPDCLWTETRTGGAKVRVENGYLTVNLGSVTSFPSNINWGQQLYLTMNIGGTGSPSWDGEMSPRLLLTATPYAFTASTLGVVDPSTGFKSTLTFQGGTGHDQDIQIPNTSATDDVCLKSLANCTGTGGGIAGSGTQYYLSLFDTSGGNHITSADSSYGAATLYNNGSFLGLGTTTNNGLLSVVGTSASQNTVFVQSAASATAPSVVIKQASSQTSNLLELQDGSGNVNASFSSAGNILHLGRAATSGTVTKGQIVLSDGTTDGFTDTIQVGTLTASGTVTIPNSGGNDTVCLLTLANCTGTGGGIAGSGTQNYLAFFDSVGGNHITAADGSYGSGLATLYDDGSFLGIGTTTNSGLLSLTGPAAGGTTGLNINTGAASNVGLNIVGVSGQSAALANILTSGGNGLTVTSTGGISLLGATTASSGLAITNGGSLATQKGTDFATTGQSNNVNFGAASLYRLTGTLAQTITGINGGVDGRILTLVNAGSNTAVLKNNDSTDSSAGNLIITGTGSDLNIAPGGSAILIYDAGDNVWRVTTGASGANSVGAISNTPNANGATITGSTLNLTVADSTNGGVLSAGTQTIGGQKTFAALLTANAGLSASGGAITLQGNAASSITTTAGDLTLDSAAALQLGNTNATSVTIGHAGITTTIAGSTAISLQGSTSTTLVCSNSGVLSSCDSSVLAPTAGNFIQNQTASTQSAGFKINGTGTLGTIQIATSGSLDTSTAGAINIGLTSGGNATSINLNQNVNLANGVSITYGTSGNFDQSASSGTFKTGTGAVSLNGDVTVAGNKSFSALGAATFQDATNSGTAFQIQNATGVNLLSVDTLTSPNLITNGSFEVNATGWSPKGGASIAQDSANEQQGSHSLAVTTTAAINDGAKYNLTLSGSTQYTVSFYAKVSATPGNNLSFGYAQDGSTETGVLTSLNQASSTAWTRYTLTFTTTSVSGTPYFFVKQSDATARTIYLDGVQIETGNTASAFNPGGQIQLLGNLNSPLNIRTNQDSTSVFTVSNASGLNLLNVDTKTGQVTAGNTTGTTSFAANAQGGNIIWAGTNGAAPCTNSNVCLYGRDNGNNRAAVKIIGAVSGNNVTFGGTGGTLSYSELVQSSANNVGLIVQGAASQVADVFELQDNNGNINSKFNADGSQLTLGRIASSGTVTQGKVTLSDGTTDNFGITIQSATLTSSQTITLPDATGTVALTNDTTNFIRNQTSQQASSNFNISNTGIAGVSFLTPLLDTPSGTTVLNIGTTNATGGINLNQNTTVATGKNLTVTSGLTSLTGTSAGSSQALVITTGATNNVGEIIRGVASQSGDLLQLQNSSNATLAHFLSDGSLQILGSANSNVALKLLASTGSPDAGAIQFGDGTGWHFKIKSGASTLADFADTGGVTLNTSNSNLTVNGGSNILTLTNGTGSTAPIAIFKQGHITNTSDFLQAQDSLGANLYRVDVNGNQETIGYYNNAIGGIGPFGNLLTYSEQFDNAAWTKTNVNNPTADTIVAPDSLTSAETLVDSASGGSVSQTSSTAPTNNSYTFSVWLKTTVGTQSADLRIDGASSGTGTAKTVTANTTWQRFFVTQNTNGFTGNIKALIFPGGTGGSGTVQAWGAQLVLASSPQVYVRTAAVTVAASTGVVSNGGVFVSSRNASDNPLVIQGAPSQTGDLLQLQDSNANINASFNATGNQLTLGRIAASGTVTQGKIVLSDGTTDNFGITLQSATLTASRTITLPDATGTVALTNDTSNFIRNQTSQQTNASFNIQAATGNVAAVIQGASGQDIVDFKENGGNTRVAVDSNGTLKLTVSSADKLQAGQIKIDSNGNLIANNNSFLVDTGNGFGYLSTNSAPDATLRLSKSTATAVGDLLQMTPYSGTVATKFDYNGQLTSYGTNTSLLNLATPAFTTTSTGSSVYYVITAYNAQGETVASASLGMANSSASLAWSQVSGATGYKIYRNISNSFTSGSLLRTTITSGTTTVFNDNGTATGAGLPPTTTTGTTLTLQAWNNQSNDVFDVKDASGNIVTRINGGGSGVATTRVSIGTSGTAVSNSAGLVVSNYYASRVGQIIQGNSSQAADLFELQDSNGNIETSFNSGGNVLTLGNNTASGTSQGSIRLTDGTSDGFYGTINLSGAIGSNQTYSLPTTGGTLCTTTTCVTALGSYINNQTSQQSNANFNIQGAAGTVAAIIKGESGGSGDIIDFVSALGSTVAKIDAGGNLTSNSLTTGPANFTLNSATSYSTIFTNATNTNTSATAATLNGEQFNLSGTNNSNAGANTVNGIAFNTVTPKTNNTFNGLYFSTGYNSLLNYNGNPIITGTGLLSVNGLSGTSGTTLVCSNGTTLSSCTNSYETTTGTDFIQNQTASTQSAGFKINGTGTVGTIQIATTGSLDTSAAGAINIGLTSGGNATSINLNQSVSVAAGKNITFASGAGNFDQSASSGTFKTGSGAVSLNGNTTIAANTNLTLASGSGVITQNYAAPGGSAQVLNVFNNGVGGLNTGSGITLNLTGNATAGTNVTSGLNFSNVTPIASNSFYGLNFGTGYNDLLRYNGNTIITGTGLLSINALSGTSGTTLVCSNGTTLSSCTNSYETTTGTDFIKNSTSQQTNASFNIQGASGNVTATLEASDASHDIADFLDSGGVTRASINASGKLTANGASISGAANFSVAIATSSNEIVVNANNTNTSATASTLNGTIYNLSGSVNNNAADTVNGSNYAAVTPVTGKTFNGLYFGTGYNSLLNYNGNAIITGTGLLSINALSGSSGTTLVCSNGTTLSSCTNSYQTALTFNNGLTNSSGTVQLGGSLIQGTTLAAGNANGITITSDLSGGARSTYPLVISQANNASNDNSVGLLQLSNSDTGSTAAVLNISQVTNGTGINVTGATGTGYGINVQSGGSGVGINSGTSGTGTGFQENNGAFITTGNGLAINGSNSGNLTAQAFTGNLIVVNPTRTNTATSSTVTDSGNFLNLTRSNTQNGAGGTFAITGALANLQSNCTQMAGSCTDSSNILNLNQQYANSTGSVLNIQNAGSGTLIFGNDTGSGNLLQLQQGGADKFVVSNTGNVTGGTINTNTFNGTTLTFGSNASAATISSGTNQNLNLQANGTGTLNLGNNGSANTIQIGNTSGAVTQTINIGNNSTASSTSNIVIGSTIAGTTTLQSAGGTTINSNVGISTGNTVTFNGSAGISYAASSTGNFDQSASSGTFATGTGAVSINGSTTIAANRSLTLSSGNGVITQNYAIASNGTGEVHNTVNNAASGSVTVNSIGLTLQGHATSGSNTINGLNFNNVSTVANNTFNGLNFGTGYDSLLNYNGTTLITGTGLLSVNALSGTSGTTLVCSNGTTLSSCTNSYEATNGTDFIQNQTASTQSAGFKINGNATAASFIVSGSNGFDTATAINLNIGLNNASSVTITPATSFSNNVTIASGKTLTAGNINTTAGQATLLGNSTGTFQLISQGGLNVATNGDLTGVNSINSGSGNFQVTSAGAITAASTYNSNTFNSNTLTFGNNGSASTIQSGTNQNLNIYANGTGTLSLGSNGSANTIQIGNTSGAVTQTINIGNNTAGSSTTNIVVGSTIAGTTTLQSAGGVSVTNGVTLQNTGSLATKAAADYTTTGAQSDVNLGAASLVRLNGASAQTLNSIAGGVDGRILTIVNAGSNAATIKNNGPATNPVNKVITGTGNDLTLPADAAITLIYDGSANRWRVSGTSASAATTSVTTVGSLNGGTANANGATISGNSIYLQSASTSFAGLIDTAAQSFLGLKTFTSGIASSGGAVNLQGNAASQLTTSSGSLTLDAATALNLGNTNATSVQIGNTTNTTTISIDAKASGTVNIANSADAHTVNIATGAAAETVAIGSTTAGSTTTISGAGVSGITLQGNTVISGTNTFTTGTGTVALNGNTILAAGKSITITGDVTANRPSSPTKGMLFFDTTTNQLIQYNGTKWVSDARTATKIVAPSTAGGGTQAEQDSADYVATGTNDDVTINAALSALPATGGTVYLEEGTYYVSNSISVPNNVTLSGAGAATIITIPNAQNGTYPIITNSDTSTGTHVTIQNLLIDGNKANQTSGSMYGVYFNGMGAVSRDGGHISGVTVRNLFGGTGYTIYLNNSSNNTVSNNNLSNSAGGVTLLSSNYNTVTGNTSYGSLYGAVVSSSAYNTFSGNTMEGNSLYGVYVFGANSNTFTGNAVQGNAYGFVVSGSSNDITGNTVVSNSSAGIYLSTAVSTTVSSNRIQDNGGATTNSGIYITVNSVKNSITGNSITDNNCNTTCVAIMIFDSGSSNNYLSNNVFAGDGTHVASISDAGTGTVYANQSRAENGGQLTIRTANDANAFQIQNATGTSIFNVNSSTAGVTIGGTLTSAGGAISLNDSSNFNTSINGGTSTGTINIGNSATTGFTLETGTATANLFNGNTNHTIQFATGNAVQNVTIGSTSSTSTLTLQGGTGASAVSVTTGAGGGISIQSGNNGSGTAGTVTIDTGTSSSGNSNISIGTTNASGITLGRVNSLVTIPSAVLLNGTVTANVNSRLQLTGTLSSSSTGSQYGFDNEINFNPTGASLGAIYGLVNIATISGSSLNIAGLNGNVTGVATTAGYTGTVTAASGLTINSPSIAGSQPFGTYSGININSNSANGGNTSGTITNQQLRIQGTTAAAGSGGIVNNYGINLTIPSGSGAGTTNNYGLYIQGAGGGTSNYSFYNSSSAFSYFAGNVGIGATSGSNALNVTGAGSFTTHVYSPDFDTASAAALTIGTSSATSVTMGTTSSTTVLQSATIYLGNASTSGTNAAPTNGVIRGTGSSTAGTAGGNVSIIGGAGATATTGSVGGNLNLTGGAGGTPATSGNARAGGTVNITGGAAGGNGAANANGGDVVIGGGAGFGSTGVQGQVKLSTTTFSAASQQSFGAGGGTVTQASVDSNSTIEIAETASGQTVAIPAPITKNTGRLLFVTITGSNAVTLNPSGGNSFTMNPNTGATLVWSVTANGWLNAGADGGSNSYIQNQNSTTQTANFKINGTGQAANFDAAATGALGLGSAGTATSVLIGGAANTFNTTVQANLIVGNGNSGSTTAFQIQNSSSTLLTADTTNNRISIGTLGTATSQLYVSGIVPTYVGRNSDTNLSGAQAVAVQGRYAYALSNGNGKLDVYDISSGTPVFVSLNSDSTLSNPKSVAVQGRYAYVVNGGSSGKLVIYDISSGIPVFVSLNSDSTLNNPQSVAVQGHYAFVTNRTTSKLVTYDISSGTPVLVGQNSDANLSSPQGLSVQGRYAYVVNATASGKLVTYDISSGIPVFVAKNSDSTLNVPQSVAVQGRYAYVTSGSSNKLVTYDISSGTPVFVGQNSDSNLSGPVGVAVQGRYAYVTNGGSTTLSTYDISSGTPVFVGQNSDSNISFPIGVVVQGRYAYVISSGNNKLATYNLGGSYIQQLEAGGAEIAQLSVDGNTNLAGDASIGGGLQIGQNLQASGDIATSSSAIAANFKVTPGTGVYDVASAGALNVGTATATSVNIGSSTSNTNTIQANGTTRVQSTTDNSAAFAVSNSAGANIFSVDTTNTATSLNLAQNGGAEAGSGTPTNWQSIGATSSFTQTTSAGTFASGAAAVQVTTTAGSSGQGVVNKLGAALSNTGTQQYTVSFSVKAGATGTAITNANLNVKYLRDGGTLDATCSSLSSSYIAAINTSGFVKVSCTLTPSTTAGNANASIIITDADSAIHQLYIDNFSVVAQNSSGTQDTAIIKIGGAVSQSLTLFQLDTYAGTPFTGANASLAGAMYFDTTAGKMQCYDGTQWGACGAAPNSNITLTPEWAGAVLNGTGIGTLTSNFCGNGGGLSVNTGFCASGEARNFYQWTSVQPSYQTYSLYVTYQLPSTFKAFVGNASLTGRVDNTTNAGVNYKIFRKSSSGGITQCGSTTNVVGWDGSSAHGSANTWTPASINPASGCSFAANDYVVFEIDATAQNSANAFIENLNFQYSNQ